jgi:hypothetical protein
MFAVWRADAEHYTTVEPASTTCSAMVFDVFFTVIMYDTTARTKISSRGKYMTERRRYLSYLLRMWQTSDGRETVWRALLQSPDGKERHGFASLEELTDFIKDQAERSKDARTRSGQ